MAMTYSSPGVYVEEVPSAVKPIAGVGTSTAGFIGIVPNTIKIPYPNPKYDPTLTVEDARKKAGKEPLKPPEPGPSPEPGPQPGKKKSEAPSNPGPEDELLMPFKEEEFPLKAEPGEARLCTTFSEFKEYFGDFSEDANQNNLAHAVYGFFHNGGTRCFVAREPDKKRNFEPSLTTFAGIDEIAIVAAPGLTEDNNVSQALVGHCTRRDIQDRVAILDSPEVVSELTLLDPKREKHILPQNSSYAAYYFPWIKVFDPATKIRDPKGDGRRCVPPSGHIAGIYARVDAERGVHKAPANEPVLGATGLKYYVSKAQQEGLNPQGVNCIRDVNGNIRVWGARTLGGDSNLEWKYINVRRLFLYLRESIDEGTQWVVFEPNDRGLWAKITRNVTAFLTNVWRAGALFGSTPQEAFYVKCDDETNPPEVRDLGQVVTEIGVAVVRPAEFVIFKISQWAGPAGK